MGIPQSSTFSTPFLNETRQNNFLFLLPGLAEFLSSDEMFKISPGYFSYLSSIQLLSSCLSVPCIIYNVILLIALLSDEDFSTWQFFPMMLQCAIDAIGPGLANIIYNYRMRSESRSMDNLPKEFEMFDDKVVVQVLFHYGRYSGNDACVWTYLREHLNELTTGICVCATGLYRYLLVCHPTYKVEDIFYKKGTAIIVSFVVLGLIAISVDFSFNENYQYLLTDSRESQLRFPIQLKQH